MSSGWILRHFERTLNDLSSLSPGVTHVSSVCAYVTTHGSTIAEHVRRCPQFHSVQTSEHDSSLSHLVFLILRACMPLWLQMIGGGSLEVVNHTILVLLGVFTGILELPFCFT